VTVYYVDATGGSDAAAGTSEAAAWKTVSKVNGETFLPADVVLFKPGEVWAENLVIPSSGNSSDPIIFGAYGTGARPILGTTGDAIFGNGKDWITVEDLAASNWTNRGIWNQNGDGWTIQRNTVAGGNAVNPVHGIRCNTTGGNITNISIRDNTVGAISSVNNDSINRVGILAQGTTGAIIRGNNIATTNVSSIWLGSSGVDNVVERNDIHDGYGGGITIDAQTRCVARYNEIHDLAGLGIGFNNGSSDTELYYNVIHDLTDTTVTWNGIDINNSAAGGVCHNNTVYAVFRHCFVIDGDSTDWVVKNNIFDASAGTTSGAHGFGDLRIIGIGNRDEAGNTGFIEDNNLVLKHASWDYYGASGAGDGTLQTLATWRAASSNGANSIAGDPLFVSASDFRLRALSPAIDAGVSVGLLIDFDDERVSAATPDMGAYEHGLTEAAREDLATMGGLGGVSTTLKSKWGA